MIFMPLRKQPVRPCLLFLSREDAGEGLVYEPGSGSIPPHTETAVASDLGLGNLQNYNKYILLFVSLSQSMTLCFSSLNRLSLRKSNGVSSIL